MSTFSGRFSESSFNSICIDNFGPQNYDCTAFFLSHFHSDHMRGIYEGTFHSLFQRPKVYFYCHELTKKFILRCSEINIPSYKIRSLDSDGTDIELSEDTWISVTWLPAGHCPGSIMLLFEGFGQRLLYTGDIRLKIDDIKNLEALHSNQKVLPIDGLYLDTTFASPIYMWFPSRQESLSQMRRHIDDWLTKNKQNKICLLSSACIGTEFLIVELHKLYGSKIHVSSQAYEKFLCCIPQLSDVVTVHPTSSRIHFCNISRCETCYRSKFPDENLLIIKLSAIYFSEDVLKEHGPVAFDSTAKILRVCYSSHASCEELIELVTYLHPERIHPCVIPPRLSIDKNQFLEAFLDMCSRKSALIVASQSEDNIDNKTNDLSDNERFESAASRYLFRPITAMEEENKDSIIQRLGLESPT